MAYKKNQRVAYDTFFAYIADIMTHMYGWSES